jgi:hypothetical protein
MTGTDVEPAGAPPKRELRIPGRDLAADAARATAGETFSEADYELMERGIAPKTKKTLREAWARVLRFTGGYGYFECPMPDATCVKMIDWCWTQVGIGGQPYSPSTVEGMLWAVTKAHNVARRPDGVRGYVSPVGSEEAKRAFRGYRAKYTAAKYRTRMATPIAPEEQVAMIRTCDTRSVIGLRDALAIAWLYDGGFRAGELVVPKEFSEETGRAGVEFEHVEIHVQGGVDWAAIDWRRPQDIVLRTVADEGDVSRLDHLVIHVPQSKTDQEGYGDEVILPAHPDRYAFNCPVRLYLAWVKLLRELDHARRGTVLRIIAHGGPEPADGRPKKGTVTENPLGYAILAVIFKRRIERAGLEDQSGRWRNFVLHGMRAGAAEAAAERDADTPELNRHFRWSQFGTTAQRYAARGLKRRKNPAARVWGGNG